jgi:hypothetical protein
VRDLQAIYSICSVEANGPQNSKKDGRGG